MDSSSWQESTWCTAQLTHKDFGEEWGGCAFKSDIGDVIMRGQGEQVLPHYCNEKDIPPLHQLEKVAIKVPNKVPWGKKEKKTTL